MSIAKTLDLLERLVVVAERYVELYDTNLKTVSRPINTSASELRTKLQAEIQANSDKNVETTVPRESMPEPNSAAPQAEKPQPDQEIIPETMEPPRDAPVMKPQTAEQEPPDTTPLVDMEYNDVKQMCLDRGMTIPPRTRKATLIKWLEEADKAPDPSVTATMRTPSQPPLQPLPNSQSTAIKAVTHDELLVLLRKFHAVCAAGPLPDTATFTTPAEEQIARANQGNAEVLTVLQMAQPDVTKLSDVTPDNYSQIAHIVNQYLADMEG